MKKLYKAEYHIPTWSDLDVDFLKKQNIKGVILDINGTLLSKGKLVPGAQKILKRLQQEEIQIGILTNNLVVSNKILKILQLDKTYIQTFALKPLTHGYRKIEAHMQCRPEEIAMITNNSLLDIVGANIARMHTIKVLEHEMKIERTIRKCHAGVESYFVAKKVQKGRQKAFREKQRTDSKEQQDRRGIIKEELKIKEEDLGR